MRFRLLLFFLLFLSLNVHAQCTEDEEPKILLIGDSWAFFMNTDQTFNTVLEKWGHSNYTYVTDIDLSVNGARTEDFLTTDRKNLMEEYLINNPTVEVVHVSLGGNDFLGDWKVSNSSSETDALKLETKTELIELFDFLKSVRPDIRIVWSGYVYANFEEVISDFPSPTDHPFYGNWENMEFPTFEELNTVLNEFSDEVIAYAAADPQLDYVHAPALMEYYFGQDVALGVAPGGTYPPFSQPLPNGDVTYPSPKESMRNYGLFRDCFHLSPEGYEVMLSYQAQKLYHKLLMDDLYLFSDVASETGSVTSTGEISDTLSIGDNGGNSHATILSFNTTLMADTVLASASIFLHRDSIMFGNPVGTTFNVRMKSGSFGADADLGTDDFIATGDIVDEACVFGETTNDGDWVRIDLPVDFLPLISNADKTQFIITITGASNELVFYSNNTDPEFAPVLNLRYKYAFAGIEESTSFDFEIYPNPTDNLLYIKSEEHLNKVEVIDLQGQVVFSSYSGKKAVNVARLAKGTYILQVTTQSGTTTKKFIKS